MITTFSKELRTYRSSSASAHNHLTISLFSAVQITMLRHWEQVLNYHCTFVRQFVAATFTSAMNFQHIKELRL